MKQYLRFMLYALLLVIVAVSVQADAIHLENGWARKMPPHMKVSAAYGTLVNTADRDKKLIAVDASPLFATVEIHTTVDENGTLRMQQLPFLLVPASGKHTLAPRHDHFMLLDRQQEAGDTVTLKLIWEDGSHSRVTIPVKSAPAH